MKSIMRQEQTVFSNQLWRTYSWFADSFTSKLEDACAEFFGLDINLKLFSLSENNNILFKGDVYFVTSVKYRKNLEVVVRLSQGAVSSILDESLGKMQKAFVIQELSELEAKIITTFNDFLFKNIKKLFIPVENIDKEEMPKSICHLVYYMEYQGIDFGKLVISIPTNIIEPEMIPLAEDAFTIANFKRSLAEVKLKVGSSKLTLGEVKGLQKDDILLLENSDIYVMTICLGDQEMEFRLAPDPSIILDTDDEGDIMTDNTTSGNNIWDSIQVDINAEFEKVKISLGELKQISEGLVVDIGSIYDNKIDLKVENKIVAKGELVIINDRYGVRIDEVVEVEEEEEPVYQATPVQVASQMEEEEDLGEEFEDDDFDYDDFDEENEI